MYFMFLSSLYYVCVWALCELSVTRCNSAEKVPTEAGSNQQSIELQLSMLATQLHAECGFPLNYNYTKSRYVLHVHYIIISVRIVKYF